MPIEKNIILTGFMGTGKTTVGKMVSRIMLAPFCDLDEVIERMASLSINDIIFTRGEPYFRKLESDAIENLQDNAGLVIATGGGAILSENNFARLNSVGIMFCLNARVDILCERLRNSRSRPLLGKDNDDRHLNDLLASRSPVYQMVMHHVDTSDISPLQAALEIIKQYNLITGEVKSHL